jgi:transposase
MHDKSRLIKMHKLQYETSASDLVLIEHVHTVFRLPPYHPDLNPIEKKIGVS